jgi:hypothetical protein
MAALLADIAGPSMPQANGQPFNILTGNCRSGCANIADVAGMRQEETLQRAARMSFDYFVAVHEADWPTAENLQESLKSLGYPLRLESAPPAPFEVTDFRTGLSVQFEGRPVILEASTEQATDVDYSDSLFGYIAECSTSEFKISNGDYFLTLTFRSDADQIRAGLYLAAAMILACNGYGFENQAETHGGAAFADRLIAEASDAQAFERAATSVPKYWRNPEFIFPGEIQNNHLPSRKRSVFNWMKEFFLPK